VTKTIQFITFLFLLIGLLTSAACGQPDEAVSPTPAAEGEGTAESIAPTTAPLPSATVEAMPTDTAVPEASPTAQSTPIATADAPLTLKINADGSGDLPSLAEAAAYAAPGSTIELSAGEFVLLDTLVIEKALAISGAGMDQTAIVAHGAEAGLQYGGDGLLSISDLTIKHAGAAAADLLSVFSGEVELSGCRLLGAPISPRGLYGAGLFVLDEAIVRAGGCEFIDNGGAGILLIRDAQITLKDSLVSANQVGILFDGRAGGEISGNIIEENTDVGIAVFAAAQPQIGENQIRNNLGYGMQYELDSAGGAARANELTNNNVIGSTATGTDIAVFGGFPPDLTGNICKGGEGLSLVLGTVVNSDPSGIVYFSANAEWPQDISPEDNQCAIAFCIPGSGEDDFPLSCETSQN
jgi:parallel beta-helix repeat protein